MAEIIPFRRARLSGFLPDVGEPVRRKPMPPFLALGRDAGSIAEPEARAELIRFAKTGEPTLP